MTVYWCMFLIIILIQLVPTSTDKGSKVKLIISLLLIFVYAAVRDDFGNDYHAYDLIFSEVHSSNVNGILTDRIELGYLWLNKIMPSYRTLLVLLSAFTCITYYWLFRKFIPAKYYWLGFALMAIFGNMMLFFQLSGLRNAIVINIMTLSLPLIKKRKIIPYFGLTVLAFFFHKSVIFFMPLAYFFATHKKLKIRTIAILSLFLVAFLVISATSLINIISPFISTYFEKYSFYLDDVSGSTHKLSILMYGFVLLTFVMSFIILIKENLSVKDKIIFKLSILFLISLTLGVLNFRMSHYFAPYLVVGTTIVMNRVKNPILKYTYLGAILIFLLYSFLLFVGDQYFSFSEYKSIFD